MIIVGIDPGDTTGFCVVDTGARSVWATQLITHEDVWLKLADVFYHKHNLTVIIEDFVGSGRRDAHIVNTIKLLGFCEYFCKLHAVPVRVQQPQFRRAFVGDAKVMFPFTNHAQSHKADAYAHILAYLVTVNSWGLDESSAQAINDQLTRHEG